MLPEIDVEIGGKKYHIKKMPAWLGVEYPIELGKILPKNFRVQFAAILNSFTDKNLSVDEKMPIILDTAIEALKQINGSDVKSIIQKLIHNNQFVLFENKPIDLMSHDISVKSLYQLSFEVLKLNFKDFFLDMFPSFDNEKAI